MTEQNRHAGAAASGKGLRAFLAALAVVGSLTALATFAAPDAGVALAHHRPDHDGGPPDQEDTATPTSTATATSTSTPTATVTGTPPTSTATSTATSTSTPTATATGTPPTSTATPTVTVTPGPTRTPLAEGERPGWGCGDENHEHIGPPGNPDAESPCDNAHGGDEDDGGDDAAVMGQSRGQDKPSKHEDED